VQLLFQSRVLLGQQQWVQASEYWLSLVQFSWLFSFKLNILSPTASPMAIPVTGNLTPTILLFMIGVVILSFSAFIWKLAEN
jgi:hypothetical protein